MTDREKLIELLKDDDCPLLWIHGDVKNLANYLIANGVTIQKWIPVTERLPEEHVSAVPGLGMVSKPVLVTWLDPTSDKAYPENCFVRECITRNGEFTIQHINGDIIPVAWMPRPKPYESQKEGVR